MKYTNRVWIKLGVVLIGLALACAVGLIWSAWDIKNQSENMQVLLIFATFFIAVGYFSFWLTEVIERRWADPFADKLFDDVRKAELGDEGEDGVCAELEHLLNKNNYTIHRNFRIPGRRYDFDAIIVGVKGIIVLEIKNHINPTLFANTTSYEEKDGNLITIPDKDDPRRKLISYCQDLERYLFHKGLGKLPINKAVVFLKKESARIIGDEIHVWVVCGVQELGKYLEGIKIDARFTPEFCKKINGILK
jgi:hypothetical protein